MPKKYKLLIDSPEFKNGIEVSQQGDGTYIHILPEGTHYRFTKDVIENRPTVWQEIEEEPEKKIVERWRGSLHETYYRMGHNKNSIPTTEISNHENAKNHANGDYFHSKQVADRAITRIEIMCRLMGLAETIEEGSTEMKGGYMLVSNGGNLYITHSYITYMSSMRLATFSTKELAQLFLESAGQDALDWYDAVK